MKNLDERDPRNIGYSDVVAVHLEKDWLIIAKSVLQLLGF